jgi:hypothetical protein
MSKDRLATIADRLVAARRQGARIALAGADVPADYEEGFAIQDKVVAALASPVAGWKVMAVPNGPVIYFLRQGALTLLACFSGPPRQAQLDEGLQLLQLQETPAEDLLRDLPPDVAALAANLLNSPLERDLLLQLWSYPRMAMQATGWAEQVGYSEDDVASALASLEQLSLVQSRCACDLTFYRLTDDEVRLRRLAQFITWRGNWLRRAQRVEQLVGPVSSRPNLIRYPVNPTKDPFRHIGHIADDDFPGLVACTGL